MAFQMCHIFIWWLGFDEVLRLPGGHIPIDTSLCGQSPQVRIYGFVAAGVSLKPRKHLDEERCSIRSNKILTVAVQERNKKESTKTTTRR